MMIPSGFKKKEPTEEEKKAAEEQKKRLEESRLKQLEIERPHVCTWCGSRAYIGCTRIECSNSNCSKYVPFEWIPPEEEDGCNDKSV